jgi:RHS repeat-associated protein
MAMKKRFYSVNGQMMGYEEGGVKKDFLTDHLGSITAEIDQNQNRTFETRYSAYGRNNWSTGTGCGFGWVGSYGYRETGLFHMSHYVRARHYSYLTGNWSTVDPLWPRESSYRYVRGNPIAFIDSKGLQRTKPPKHLPPLPVDIPWIQPLPFPIPGPIPFPGPVPNPTGFPYGQYCGSANIKNPGSKILPQDCVDDCCRVHDRCLEAHYGAGVKEGSAHRCCDHELAQCTEQALMFGCCKRSPLPSECEKAGRMISHTFNILCMKYGCERPAPTGGRPGCLPKSEWPPYYQGYWGGCGPNPKQGLGPPDAPFIGPKPPVRKT